MEGQVKYDLDYVKSRLYARHVMPVWTSSQQGIRAIFWEQRRDARKKRYDELQDSYQQKDGEFAYKKALAEYPY